MKDPEFDFVALKGVTKVPSKLKNLQAPQNRIFSRLFAQYLEYVGAGDETAKYAFIERFAAESPSRAAKLAKDGEKAIAAFPADKQSEARAYLANQAALGDRFRAFVPIAQNLVGFAAEAPASVGQEIVYQAVGREEFVKAHREVATKMLVTAQRVIPRALDQWSSLAKATEGDPAFSGHRLAVKQDGEIRAQIAGFGFYATDYLHKVDRVFAAATDGAFHELQVAAKECTDKFEVIAGLTVSAGEAVRKWAVKIAEKNIVKDFSQHFSSESDMLIVLSTTVNQLTSMMKYVGLVVSVAVPGSFLAGLPITGAGFVLKQATKHGVKKYKSTKAKEKLAGNLDAVEEELRKGIAQNHTVPDKIRKANTQFKRGKYAAGKLDDVRAGVADHTGFLPAVQGAAAGAAGVMGVADDVLGIASDVLKGPMYPLKYIDILEHDPKNYRQLGTPEQISRIVAGVRSAWGMQQNMGLTHERFEYDAANSTAGRHRIAFDNWWGYMDDLGGFEPDDPNYAMKDLVWDGLTQGKFRCLWYDDAYVEWGQAQYQRSAGTQIFYAAEAHTYTPEGYPLYLPTTEVFVDYRNMTWNFTMSPELAAQVDQQRNLSEEVLNLIRTIDPQRNHLNQSFSSDDGTLKFYAPENPFDDVPEGERRPYVQALKRYREIEQNYPNVTRTMTERFYTVYV
ncbi:hypothetical protein AB0B52_37605 [Streptomyces griseofuscus]|uniref:hypothetical protein n=1 Tax=Streptomyces griseofuscus TaxID=146922 RepID=UPI0033DD093A